MESQDLRAKLLWQMTGAELLQLIIEGNSPYLNKTEYPHPACRRCKYANSRDDSVTVIDTTKKEHVYGIAGIASLFGCSRPTASRIKKSGVIDRAITQIGRKIIVDAELALELAGHKTGGRK